MSQIRPSRGTAGDGQFATDSGKSQPLIKVRQSAAGALWSGRASASGRPQSIGIDRHLGGSGTVILALMVFCLGGLRPPRARRAFGAVAAVAVHLPAIGSRPHLPFGAVADLAWRGDLIARSHGPVDWRQRKEYRPGSHP